jgi:hypothetical protein
MTKLRALTTKEVLKARAEGWPTGTSYEKVCEAQLRLATGQFLVEMSRDEQIARPIVRKYITWAVDCGIKIPTREEVKAGDFE